MEEEKSIELLNELLQKNIDAVEGFQKVADKTENLHLKDRFNNYAEMHVIMANQLRQEVATLEGIPRENGSKAAIAHRAWIDVKHFLAQDNEEALLQSCMQGLEATEEQYEQVLAEAECPPVTMRIIREQRNKIQTALIELRKEEIARNEQETLEGK